MSGNSITTELFVALRTGDADSAGELFPRLYEDLRAVARQRLRQLRPGETLNTTALVHEAYIRLVDQSRVELQDRAHFLALASRAMRFVLVDYARARSAEKRGGGQAALTLDRVEVGSGEREERLVELDEALTRLAAFNPALAEVVEYRYFGGMTHEEIAGIRGCSVPTVKREWARARAWLLRDMTEEDGQDGSDAEPLT